MSFGRKSRIGNLSLQLDADLGDLGALRKGTRAVRAEFVVALLVHPRETMKFYAGWNMAMVLPSGSLKPSAPTYPPMPSTPRITT
jgi:hypothetical protein